jgi:hypothetical protein
MHRYSRSSEAATVLGPIRDDFDVIENASYYRLLKLYKGVDSGRPSDTSLRKLIWHGCDEPDDALAKHWPYGDPPLDVAYQTRVAGGPKPR